MRTIEMNAAEMGKRIARFSQLQPLAIQNDPDIPLEAKDLIYCRQLLSVIGLEDVTTPINANAPIRGAAGITITIAICPPGTGPSLHAHHKTYETFTVLEGRFEFRWNDEGEESVILEKFDTISVPPRVNRCFRNVSDVDGVLQVLISGGVHDMNDIDGAPAVGEKLATYGEAVKKKFEAVGLTFTAHKNAAE